MKTFSVLASLVRAANPWLSKATCPCKSTYGIVGVSPNLLSMSMSSLSLTCTPSSAHGYVFIRTLVAFAIVLVCSKRCSLIPLLMFNNAMSL